MAQHEEAKISVILPTILPNDMTIVDIVDEMDRTLNQKLYIYYVPFDEDTLPDPPEVISTDASLEIFDGLFREEAVVISDRVLTKEQLLNYYSQIMDYHQAIDENLSDEDMAKRDEEVKSKWLNGNFNYWILD